MPELCQQRPARTRRVRMEPLYERLPRGPNGMRREDVARHQRARIVGAMIEAVDRRGFERTTVADVIELAGVSRRAFYEQFQNKQDCLLAAHDVVVARARRESLAAWRRERDHSRRMRAAWESVLGFAARSPRGPRLALLGVPEAGAGAHLRIQLAELAFERPLARALGDAPGGARVPALVPRAIVGGARRVISRRLRDRREHELPGLAGELLDWADCFLVGPPAPSARASRCRSSRERCDGLCDRRIAPLAEVSAYPMKASCATSRAAFLAAREDLAASALACARARAGLAADWPHAVRLGLAGFVGLLLSADGLARVLFVEPYAAGAGGRIADPVDELAAMLLTGAPAPARGAAVAAEALRGALCSLLSSRLPAGRPRRPEGLCDQLAFIVLAPYLGAEHAIAASRGLRVAG